MAIRPNQWIKTNNETTTFGLNEVPNSNGTTVLFANLRDHPAVSSSWSTYINNTPQKSICLNKIEDCYYLVYKNLLNEATPEKAKEYETLLKINQEDYRLTVLQIEIGEKHAS